MYLQQRLASKRDRDLKYTGFFQLAITLDYAFSLKIYDYGFARHSYRLDV